MSLSAHSDTERPELKNYKHIQTITCLDTPLSKCAHLHALRHSDPAWTDTGLGQGTLAIP